MRSISDTTETFDRRADGLQRATEADTSWAGRAAEVDHRPSPDR